MRTVLVTGAAGFIGYHVAARLLEDGHRVVGVDFIGEYYEPKLKEDRVALLQENDRFRFVRADLADAEAMDAVFAAESFDRVIHLGAQAGVRYSVENPRAYTQSNLVGFSNVLEGCRQSGVAHLVYASSSSVYGANTVLPFSTQHPTDHPVSFYAATKKANEVMAHAFSYIYDLPTTGLRFFTVYGPWGRPDMAIFKFTRAILAGQPIDLYNEGQMLRDFTFVDDIVEGVVRIAEEIPEPATDWDPDLPSPERSGVAPYRLFNIGNHDPVQLLDFVRAIEDAVGTDAQIRLKPMQTGDVVATHADVEDLAETIRFRPQTPLAEGVRQFVEWYRGYYAPVGAGMDEGRS